jgi:hypothetical protein
VTPTRPRQTAIIERSWSRLIVHPLCGLVGAPSPHLLAHVGPRQEPTSLRFGHASAADPPAHKSYFFSFS